MATFTIERVVAAPPAKVWEIITDWAGYARWMPLTTMRLDPGPTGVGWSFAGDASAPEVSGQPDPGRR